MSASSQNASYLLPTTLNLPNPIMQLLAQAQSVNHQDESLESSIQQILQANAAPQIQKKRTKKEQDPNKPSKKKSKTEQEEENGDKRRAPKACVHCQRSHLSCEAARPCKRCIDRKIAHTCVDPPSKPKGRKRKDATNSYEQLESPTSVNFISSPPPIVNPSPFAPPNDPQILQRVFGNQNMQIPTSSLQSPITLPVPNSPLQTTFSNSLGLQNFGYTPLTPSFSASAPSDAESSPMSDEILSLSEVLFAPLDKMDFLFDNNPLTPSFNLPQTPNSAFSENKDEISTLNSSKQGISSLVYNPESFNKLLSYIKKRTPEMADDIKSIINLAKPKLLKVLQSMNREQLQDIRKTFDDEIAFAKATYGKINVPTIVWEKCSSIHYCNSSFRSLTGFSSELPTEPFGFAIFDMISTTSLKRFLQVFSNTLTDGVTSFIVLPVEWMCYGKLLNVIGCFTLKRDFTGLPILITAHLLPVVFSPVLDIQFPTISRRPFEGSLYFQNQDEKASKA